MMPTKKIDMAKAEAKIADADDSGARLSSPRDIGLGRSPPEEAAGRRTTSDTSPPTASTSPLPPEYRSPWNPAPSALAAPHAHDAYLPPQPSAPTLELLMEAGFFDGPTDDHPTSDGPFRRDNGELNRGHAWMTPLAEAAVVLMPVCEAVGSNGRPFSSQDEEDNAAQAGWPVKCGTYMMIGVALLVFVSVGTLIAVVVMMVGFIKQDDPVTTTPEMNSVSEKSTDCMLAVYFRR
jgi:hypothetical protein